MNGRRRQRHATGNAGDHKQGADEKTSMHRKYPSTVRVGDNSIPDQLIHKTGAPNPSLTKIKLRKMPSGILIGTPAGQDRICSPTSENVCRAIMSSSSVGRT